MRRVNWDGPKVKPETPFDKLSQAFNEELYQFTRNLEGRLLTIVDASFPDREQREAVKSLVRQNMYDIGYPIGTILRQFTNKYNGKLIEKMEPGDNYPGMALPRQNYFPVDNEGSTNEPKNVNTKIE